MTPIRVVNSSLILTDIDKINATARAPTDSQNPHYPCRECNKVFNRQGRFEFLLFCLSPSYIMNCSERLASHMLSHRPHRCTITNCGKEFKFKAHLARHCATAHGLAMRSGSPRPIMKTRAAFYLCATLAARVARRLCSKVLRPRHATRNPFLPININAIRLECKSFTVRSFQSILTLCVIKSKVKQSSRMAFLRCQRPDLLKGEKWSTFLTD